GKGLPQPRRSEIRRTWQQTLVLEGSSSKESRNAAIGVGSGCAARSDARGIGLPQHFMRLDRAVDQATTRGQTNTIHVRLAAPIDHGPAIVMMTGSSPFRNAPFVSYNPFSSLAPEAAPRTGGVG